jgi:Uma2 family endonuclease
MSSVISPSIPVPPLGDQDYPTSDGRPMGETDLHRNVMFDTIETLKAHFAGQLVYVTGNLLLFYEEGNRRRHVSPDCFVVKGLEQRDRLNYLLWQEGRSPNVVIEITSASTRREDTEFKMGLYRDKIGVAEYFLFDPWQEYLTPSLQGYRLHNGQYVPLSLIAGRMPSEQLNLHLEAIGTQLRFFDPMTSKWVPTWKELYTTAEEVARQAEEVNSQLRRELEELRRKIEGGNS